MRKFETTTPVDFVVIGAGAAGGVVAKELSTAGFQVVVLEQGPYLRAEDFVHDEFKNKQVWAPPYIGQDISHQRPCSASPTPSVRLINTRRS